MHMGVSISSKDVNHAISSEPQLQYSQLIGLGSISTDAINNSIFRRSAKVDNVVIVVGTKSLDRYSDQDTHIMITMLARPSSPINTQHEYMYVNIPEESMTTPNPSPDPLPGLSIPISAIYQSTSFAFLRKHCSFMQKT
jgi:hypothetical protein